MNSFPNPALPAIASAKAGNKTVTCCLCTSKRDVLTAQPDGPCCIFCPKCGRHTTHTRAPIAQRQPETYRTLAKSVRNLTSKMLPEAPTGRDRIAQGNALGNEANNNGKALKGRNSVNPS